MTLPEAHDIAHDLQQRMAPYCERIEIAGSIRRQRPEPGDVELVAIPKWAERPDPTSLLGEPVPVNLLHEWAQRSGIYWIKPATPEIIRWELDPKAKYWRALLNPVSPTPDTRHPTPPIKLDLFLTTSAQWGLIYLIRTGSAEFSQAVVTHAHRFGKRSEGGHLKDVEGRIIPTPEEQDVFRALNLRYIEPEHRTGKAALAYPGGRSER